MNWLRYFIEDWIERLRGQSPESNSLMQISDQGITLVKHFEWYYPDAYQCEAGVWSIGYGHTTGVKKGDHTTPEQAETWLVEDLAEAEEAVRQYITAPISQWQYDALVAFTMNCGAGALAESTMRKRINDLYETEDIVEAMSWWNKVKDSKTGEKRVSAGLLRRRKSEGYLYQTGMLNYFEG